MISENESQIILLISFRGKKIEMELTPETSVWDVKSELLSSIEPVPSPSTLGHEDIKLIHKGRVIKGLDVVGDFSTFLMQSLKKKTPSSSSLGKKIVVRLMATGLSPTEARDVERSKVNAPRIRDDLSEAGIRDLEARQRLGRKIMMDTNRKGGIKVEKYGFGRIETLPMLPEQKKSEGNS